MIRPLSGRLVFLVAFDSVLIVCAVAAAAFARLGTFAWSVVLFDGGILKTLLLAGVTQACLYYADLYNFRIVADRRELFIRILQAIGTASLILAAIYYWFEGMIIGRGVFLIAAVFEFTLVVGWRLTFDWLGQHVAPSERLLIVGTSAAAVTLGRELFDRRAELGISIVGFVDPDPVRVGEPVINPGVIGSVDDIPAIVRDHHVDRVVVSLADARGKLPMYKLLEMKIGRGVSFDHLATIYEQYTGKIAVENLRPSWLIFSEGFRTSALFRATKRAIDLVLSAIGLIVLSPVLLIVAMLVKVTSPGPVLFHQRRVGLNGQLFTVHKVRSMWADAEAHTGAVWATPEDPRATRVGLFLRRTRLDEIPQLWNVLVGEMSLVGPRPERPEFIAHLAGNIPYYGLRHGVRPGLTGWAQVRYTYAANVEDHLEKLQYDLFYVKHLSILFDLFILFATVKTVLLRRGGQ